jgi:hypothetical protein
MVERRKESRRRKWVRNIFSYLNRRDLFRKGRRHDEEKYQAGPDWFEREDEKPD